MGQALRRATGIGSSRVGTPSQLGKPIEHRPPPPPEEAAGTVERRPTDVVDPGSDSSRVNTGNVLEDRDPQFDAMLGQMVGRIRAKPGGKLEMGEASVVDRYKRPLPKLRNTNPDSSKYEGRPAPPGTLNVAQLRQIILLHQGKSNDHDGPMDVDQIAQRFKIDAAQVQKIVQFVAIPPEDDSRRKKDNQE